MKRNALVISPGGDENLLQDTKSIIASAKDCEGWEYYYVKPPKEKDWDLIFYLKSNKGDIVEIDASLWEYTLLQYEDEMFEAIVKASNLEQLDEMDKQIAAEILLDGILGEEVRIRTICVIDVVEMFEAPYGDKAGNIRYLANHLENLCQLNKKAL